MSGRWLYGQVSGWGVGVRTGRWVSGRWVGSGCMDDLSVVYWLFDPFLAVQM